jgi:nicotinate dehydrogenase subunit B
VVNAGGRPMETPFGVIYSTNITPDVETGIGNWSYPAFERAMREGIHRDGRQLYPAFPYPHFARVTDADLQALYAYLMAQSPVRAETPKNALAFPFNLRPLMAGWNALFHQPDVFQADATKSAMWNRGAYLVEGLGHCGACHSPRNELGAEIATRYLAGGFAEGWEAPALTSLSRAPIPWSEAELYAYLRTGESRFHGVAAGPMAPVVKELKALPDQDIRAMAVYLGSFNETPIGNGLYVVIQASGRKGFCFRYRHPITRLSRKLTLPAGLSLAQARKLAKDADSGTNGCPAVYDIDVLPESEKFAGRGW